MSNATDTEDRIRQGFADLLDRPRADGAEDPDKAAKANAAALERERARVRAEYLHHGIEPPSPLALSITARRELGLLPVDQPQEAAE